MHVLLFAINVLIFSINFPTFALEQDIEIDEEDALLAMPSSEEKINTRYELRSNKRNRDPKLAKKKEASTDKKKKTKRQRSESSQSDSQEETEPPKKKKRASKKNEMHAETKSFKCTYQECGQTFSQKGNLQKHISSVHLGERPFECTIEGCGKKFTTAANLKAHLRTHSGERPYECTQCGGTFTRKTDYKEHLKIHLNDKTVICSHAGCGKAFVRKKDLKKHIKIHTGEKRHVCAYKDCKKAFITKSDLLEHLNTHTGERPFKCDHCQAAFAARSNLRQHYKIHTGEMNFKCTFESCTRTFITKAKLNNHVKVHQGLNPHACSYKRCRKSFATIVELISHKEQHEVIKIESEVANERSAIITKADIEKNLPDANPGHGIRNCRPLADKVHKWLKWQTKELEAVGPDIVEERNFIFIITSDGSEEYGTLTNHLHAREMARPQSSEHVIDDEQSSCHIHKPKFIKKNNKEFESYIESLPKIKFKDGNDFVTGILYLESKTEEGKGHFLNFYVYYLGDEKHSYIIDGQTAVIESVENFIPMSAYFYKDDFFVWHDNEHSLVAVTAHWEDQLSEELVAIKKEPNSDEEERIEPPKKIAKRKNSGSDLNQEPPKRARLNEANEGSGRASKRKTRKSKDSDDEDFEPGKQKSKRNKR